MDWSYNTFLGAMLAFCFWFAAIWMFIAVFGDIFRRDTSGWAKAGWVAFIVLLPFLGSVVYLIVRGQVDQRGAQVSGLPTQHRPSTYEPADEIAKAADLQDRGRISAEEFEQIKRQAILR